ncbi:MAG: DUF2256 domain-containing protein [Gammaproteobacteria bacterium]|nr:DUF2256 domain-containing protein [Gammaproteobacteria bacterium]
MAHKKPHLPEKKCLTCGRPFSWRKKWERNWDEVKYCSKRCGSERNKTASQEPNPSN